MHFSHRLALIALAISPFLVGFTANDSTGWTGGAGISRSRNQYVTGCTPKYYSIRHMEADAQVEYVRARNPEKSLSPAMQIQGSVGVIQNRKTLLAEERRGSSLSDIPDSLYLFPESDRITTERTAALLKIKGALAWKYLELSLGVLAGTQGGMISNLFGDEPVEGSNPYEIGAFPCGGFKIIPWGGFYASYQWGYDGPTIHGAPFISLGLGHQGIGHNIWVGMGGGLDGGTKATLSVEKHFEKFILAALGSVFLDVDAQQAAPLRPGDWGDLGLAIRIPIRN